MSTREIDLDELAGQVEELVAVQDRTWQVVASLQEQQSEAGLAVDIQARLGDLDEVVTDLGDELARQRSAIAALLAQKRADDQPQYETLHVWVAEQFLATLEREPAAEHTRWCPQWWAHPEAVNLLEAMWRSWEHARKDVVNGMAWWYREVYTPLGAGILLAGAAGPFSGCRETRHHHLEPLPTTVPPSEMVVHWDTDDRAPAVGRRRPRRRRRPTDSNLSAAGTNGTNPREADHD